MTQVKFIIFIVSLLFVTTPLFADKTERDYLREGNKQFRHKSFVQAEVYYRKALEINPNSKEALYNLGNTLSNQGKLKESIDNYVAASKGEKNKTKLAKIYHNSGVLYYAAKHYQEAIQAYRQSLRNNPNDDETRYNLALAQEMLKNQPKNQQQKEKDKKKDKQKEKKDQEKKNKPEDKSQGSKKNQMSKENAEQLLNAAMQDEKQLQEKVKKKLVNQNGNLEKDW